MPPAQSSRLSFFLNLAAGFTISLAANATDPIIEAQLFLDLGDQLIRATRHLVKVHGIILAQDVGTRVGVAIDVDIHLDDVQDQVVVPILTNKLGDIRVGVLDSRVPEFVQLPLLRQKHQKGADTYKHIHKRAYHARHLIHFRFVHDASKAVKTAPEASKVRVANFEPGIELAILQDTTKPIHLVASLG